jgi:hypothetical protein
VKEVECVGRRKNLQKSYFSWLMKWRRRKM